MHAILFGCSIIEKKLFSNKIIIENKTQNYVQIIYYQRKMREF